LLHPARCSLAPYSCGEAPQKNVISSLSSDHRGRTFAPSQRVNVKPILLTSDTPARNIRPSGMDRGPRTIVGSCMQGQIQDPAHANESSKPESMKMGRECFIRVALGAGNFARAGGS